MKTIKVFVVSTSIIAFIFLVFVGYYWNYSLEREQRRVDTHSRVIASATWDFYIESMTEYCKLASKAYNYKHILVTKSNGETIISIESSLQKPLDRFLLDMGLLQTINIESEIKYENQVIGRVIVTWLNTAIYTILYTFVIVMLILTILWFFLRTVRAKQELENRVEERTVHLQKEIVERKQAEKELETFAKRLAIHVEQTPLGVIEWDLDFKVIQWNKAAEEIFGYTHEEAFGQYAADLIIPEQVREHVSSIWNDLINKEGGTRSENENITKNGNVVTCEWYNTTLVDSEDVVIGVASLVLNISESKRLESQLRQAQKMEAIGTLAGGIAHDFNNLLAAILGYADMAMDDIPDHSPVKDQIEEVLKAGNRAKELVKHILSFSRKEAQERVPVRIYHIAIDALKLLRASIPTTIEIKQNTDSRCGNILADPTQIHQVLINLCTNAAQSMDENGGLLEVELISVQLNANDVINEPNLKTGHYVRLSVKDTGIGIDKEHIDRIFDPYFTTKDVGKGTGMGLAVVVGIVKSHDGMITVDSKTDKGTTFNVYFPRIEEQTQEIIEETAPLPTGTEKILVVDDEKSIIDMIKGRLERLGYQVTTRTSSMDALELFRSQPNAFDLVLTDQTMPELTGEKLATQLLEISPNLPIIICTGYSAKMDAGKASSIGISAFIMKPVDKKELAMTIRQVLDKDASNV